MRIAWFSPLPPVRTGIAACSAELVAALRRRGYAIDLYPAEAAHDFPWRHRQHPYDLIVYQMGNSSHHDYEWAYALRYPGLVVLHDTRLHHARAAFLLRERRAADYRAEFRWNHPQTDADAAELAVAGFPSALYYEWPMVRGLAAVSRGVALHVNGEWRMQNGENGENHGNDENDATYVIRLGHGRLVTTDEAAAARAKVRATYGIAADAVLFVCAGVITPEKRVPQVLAAFKATLSYAPDTRLLLVGAAASHYDVRADIAAHGLTDRVIVTGYVDSDDELTEHLAASDVSLNLRWPTAGEISGPWLRALAAGVATVITDLAHLGQVPSLDPRTWRPNMPASDFAPPVCVAIDILDEDHSLRLAMRRLATDEELRRALGRAGQEYWAREHTIEAMADDYERVMRDAAARHDPVVPQDAPPHVRDRGDAALRSLLEPFGLASPL